MFEFLLYELSYLLALSLPFPLKYFIACRLADLFYIFLPSRRKAVWDNLGIITGKSRKETLYYVRKVYYNFARFVAELLSLPRLNKKRAEEWIEIVHPEFLRDAFSSEKGVICLTAHLGNWEWGGAYLSLLGYPINAIILPQKNPMVARLFFKLRTSSGMRIINVGGGAKKSIKVLRNGEGIAILGDRPFGEEGIRVNFFGKEVIFPRGPASLCYYTNAMILPGFTVREGKKYKLYMEKPFSIRGEGEKEEIIRKGMEKIISLMEKYIRKYPEQWAIFEEVWGKVKKSV